MPTSLENDLKQCLSLLTPQWKIQSNYLDKQTNFIYRVKTLEELISKIKINDIDMQYALHRWYNYMTSIQCENIFCEYGAVHESNLYNHDVDIYINKIPFDVKLTYYPLKLNDKPYDLNTRIGKNEMIKWYYAHQSQQNRKQNLNRIYVVCDGKDNDESMKMKSDFQLLRQKISIFMESAFREGINSITITDDNDIYSLFSDIIYVTYNNR